MIIVWLLFICSVVVLPTLALRGSSARAMWTSLKLLRVLVN